MQRTINKFPQTPFFRTGTLGNNLNSEKDPYFSNVSALLKFEGANNGSTFTDSSSNNITFTRTGTAITSTLQARFGTSSGYFDSSGDYIQASTNALFGFGTGDLTIECWIYKDIAIANYNTIFDVGTNDILLRPQIAGLNSLIVGGTSYSWYPSRVIPLYKWVHLAVVRESGTLSMYVDGIRIISATNTADLGATKTLTIGTASSATTQGFNGWIDEFRVTKGVARYSGTNFAVPTTAFLTQ